jgi:predicted HNH restriction endonuclease
VVQALNELGWFADSESDGGLDHDLVQKVALEGQVSVALRTHRRREQSLRRAKLRQVLSDLGRLACEVPGCGFDFAAAYGALGNEFAEVHHLSPLASTVAVHETTLKDLAVVCSNCHRMIHRGGLCRSLAQVGAALLAQPNQRLQRTHLSSANLE